MRSGIRVGAGQSSAMAARPTNDAVPQPARRGSRVSMPPGSETGRMNVSRSAVLADARTSLTVPTKSTTNATTAIDSAPSHTGTARSVPRQTNTAPAIARASCAWRRSLIVPPKPTKSSIASEPKAQNSAKSGLCTT
ncbi:hypothetical protein GCM10027414_33690 [Humibacter ginsengiterrae]